MAGDIAIFAPLGGMKSSKVVSRKFPHSHLTDRFGRVGNLGSSTTDSLTD